MMKKNPLTEDSPGIAGEACPLGGKGNLSTFRKKNPRQLTSYRGYVLRELHHLLMKNPGFTRARAFAARYRSGLAGSLVAGVHATGGHRLRTNHRVPLLPTAESYPESTGFASSAVNDGSIKPASFLAGDF